MPPKVRITKEDIINTSVELIRENGKSFVNARSIAAALGCSTQPVFSNFATMDELFDSVLKRAHDIYLGFLKREAESGKYPEYKSFGMAYIRFAREERELFKLLFMCDRGGRELVPTTDYDSSVEMIMSTNGIPKEKAELIHFETWTCVHGIGTMIATSFLELDTDTVSTVLTDVYMGIRARHLREEA